MKQEWFKKQEEFKQALLNIKDWETKAIRKMDNPFYKERMKSYKKGATAMKPLPYWYYFNFKNRKAFKDLGLAQGIVFENDEQKDEFLNWINGDYKAPYIWFLTQEMWDYRRATENWAEYYETRKRFGDSMNIDIKLNTKPQKKWWEFWK